MGIPFTNNTLHGGSINVDVDVGTGSEEGQILYYDATNNHFTDTSILHIDATNNRVGVGTTTPEKLFHIKGDTAPTLRITDTPNDTRLDLSSGDTSATIETFSNHPLIIGTNNQERMRITEGGNVGIGTTNPSLRLHVLDETTDFTAIFKNGTSSGNGLKILAGDNSGDRILQLEDKDGNEKMRVISTGNVGIGTTSPSFQLELSTDSAGKPTSSTWTITSDERVKSNIVDADLQTCYDLVKNLPLKRYKWSDKYLPNVEDRHMLGWIAQDVQKVLPKSIKTHSKTFVVGKELENVVETVVETNEETGEQVEKQIEKQVEKEITETIDDFLSLDSDQIIKMLFGAVQKLQKEVEELKQSNTH